MFSVLQPDTSKTGGRMGFQLILSTFPLWRLQYTQPRLLRGNKHNNLQVVMA